MAQIKYTFLERLGGGGQAEVFRGLAESMEGFRRPVALKRVLPNLTSNPQFVSMFLDEARLSLFLQHANVVQVFDIARAPDGTYFLAMEYVDGCDLKALIEHEISNKRSANIALVLHIVIECCKGLHYAHTLEHPETGQPLHIVHRDISPPNVMLSKNGEVKVVDFGLAKANSQLEITDEGVVKGKFSYLAPETALGQHVDARADVFALGILLWEMLTERRLFIADTPYETVSLIRRARMPSIIALNPNVDPELEAIVRTALAKDRDQRYETAADLGEALTAYLFSRGIKATSKDVALTVRDIRSVRAKRSSPRAALTHALVQDEINKLTTLVAEELASARQPEPVTSPGSMVDTTDWAADLED
ncbi:MAG: serine/threonine protein kinase [Deltaproteobacteria bacterium]|nr:serine/threonine protein kinase [Deltaproteobacteria bacterium]MCW5806214.1 serine/threonine protein kinase [Deltaproteobacteria bacterium]